MVNFNEERGENSPSRKLSNQFELNSVQGAQDTHSSYFNMNPQIVTTKPDEQQTVHTTQP